MPPRTITIDTSGKDGTSGAKGIDGMGSDGDPGQDGSHAEDIILTVSTETDHINVIQNQKTVAPITLPFYVPYDITLRAQGGKGGYGGDGGKGRDGKNGTNGTNATQYSHGTDGTSGENGRPGGKGGRGGNGGNGGNVVIHLSEANTDLLPLFTLSNSALDAGLGGNGGKGGAGGKGGNGGRGGASYSWIETKIRVDGSAESIYHTHSGGSDGFAGYNGSTGADGKPGKRGINGHCQYVVTDEQGNIQRYDDTYRLRVVSFKVTLSPDRINEPGETLAIYDIVLKNTGKMPTPPNDSFIISGKDTDWIKFSTSLSLPERIYPDQVYSLPGTLPFKIVDNMRVTVDETFKVVTTVNLKATLPRINKEVDTLSQPQELIIRYPAELTAMVGKRSILPSEQLPMAFKLYNLSIDTLGTDAGHHASRALQVHLTASHHPLSFTYADSFKSDITAEGFTQPLVLEAGASALFSGTINTDSLKLPSYSIVKFEVKLCLGALRQPSHLQIIQQRTFNLQLAEAYHYDPDAEVVLVINGQLNAEIIAAWKKLPQLFPAKKIGVWNTSLYGGVSYRYQRQADQQSFMTQLRGKTLVIWNNAFTDDMGASRRATDYLDTVELFESARYAGIATYMMGEGFDLHRAVLPLAAYPQNTHANIEKCVRSLQDKQTPSMMHDQVERTSSQWFGRQPNFKKLRNEANRCSRQLAKHFPGRNYMTLFSFEPTMQAKGCLSQRWREGAIEVRRALDRDRVSIVHSKTDPAHITDADLYVLFKLMPFDVKLSKIPQCAHDAKTAALLTQALLSDLAEEQMAFRKAKWSGPLSANKLKAQLQHFNQLCFLDVTTVSSHPAAVTVLKEILAQYAALVQVLPARADYWLLNRRGRILTNLCYEKVTAWLVKHRKALGLSKREIQKSIGDYVQEYKTQKPDVLLTRFAKPNLSSSHAILQDNEVSVEAVVDRQTLPSVVSCSLLKPREHQYNFRDETERKKAIEEVEQLVSGPVL